MAARQRAAAAAVLAVGSSSRAAAVASVPSCTRCFASSSSSSSSSPSTEAEPLLVPPLLGPSVASPGASKHVLLANLPRSAGPADIVRLAHARVPLDLHSLHFLRTPSLYPTGQAIANFNTDAAARRFQRAVDGAVLSGRPVRAVPVPARSASQKLRESISAHLSTQFIHLLISQGSGSNVLLRGLPPSLYVSRLHELLHKGYSLAPNVQFRPSRRNAHLAPLFDRVPALAAASRRLLARRKDEVYTLIRRRTNMGLRALLEQMEHEDERFAAQRAESGQQQQQQHQSDAFSSSLDDLVNDNDVHSHLGTSSLASLGPNKSFGIEGPDLRAPSPGSGPDDPPFAYTQPSKAFWDTVWDTVRRGHPSLSNNLSRQQPQQHQEQQAPRTECFVPYSPIVKLPYPPMGTSPGTSDSSANHRCWFVVRLTDSADAHRLVRRWHNMYFDERQFGKRYLIEAQILY